MASPPSPNSNNNNNVFDHNGNDDDLGSLTASEHSASFRSGSGRRSLFSGSESGASGRSNSQRSLPDIPPKPTSTNWRDQYSSDSLGYGSPVPQQPRLSLPGGMLSPSLLTSPTMTRATTGSGSNLPEGPRPRYSFQFGQNMSAEARQSNAEAIAAAAFEAAAADAASLAGSTGPDSDDEDRSSVSTLSQSQRHVDDYDDDLEETGSFASSSKRSSKRRATKSYKKQSKPKFSSNFKLGAPQIEEVSAEFSVIDEEQQPSQPFSMNDDNDNQDEQQPSIPKTNMRGGVMNAVAGNTSFNNSQDMNPNHHGGIPLQFNEQNVENFNDSFQIPTNFNSNSGNGKNARASRTWGSLDHDNLQSKLGFSKIMGFSSQHLEGTSNHDSTGQQQQHQPSFPMNNSQQQNQFGGGIQPFGVPGGVKGPQAAAAGAGTPMDRQRQCLYFMGCIICLLFVGALSTLLVVLLVNGSNNDPVDGSSSATPGMSPTIGPTDPPHMIPTAAPTIFRTSPPVEIGSADILERITNQGFIKCGVTAEPAGSTLAVLAQHSIEMNLCEGLAAAILGDKSAIEIFDVKKTDGSDGFLALGIGDIDVLAGGTRTILTMERAIYESNSRQGLTASSPYFYDTLGFGGSLSVIFDCFDNVITNITSTSCSGLNVCVVNDHGEREIPPELLPPSATIVPLSTDEIYLSFNEGSCDVIAGSQFHISAVVVFSEGYTGGDYEVSQRVMGPTPEPLVLWTTKVDPNFSKFVSWFIEALVRAEEQEINSSTANAMESHIEFGQSYANAFIRAVESIGNYGDVYERNLASILPRAPINQLHTEDTPALFTYPLGNLQTEGPTPRFLIKTISDRGFLRCGVTRRRKYADYNTIEQAWQGLDIDLCRGISAGIFDGVFSNIEVVELTAKDRFMALSTGEVDVLTAGVALTLQRNVKEETSNQGYDFSPPVFYDGLFYGGGPTFVECAYNLDTSSDSCSNLLICVTEGTVFEQRLIESGLPERYIVPVVSYELALDGLRTDDCNVVAGGTFDVSLAAVNDSGYEGSYEAGTDQVSHETIGIVTRSDDAEWSNFVSSVVTALLYAETEGITQSTSSRMPVVDLFGRGNFRVFRDVIGAVGSFAEIYNRNMGDELPRNQTKMNLLNQSPYQPQLITSFPCLFC